ncbi:MAG TPA: homocysteine S-methyltransferase family protein, partial [Solirubrobacterales bacterium]|nr:homocysteine S-methyltransferase family protein [Solirubrobacterales bacterium]
MGHEDQLPQLRGGRFLTDGGIETYMVFQRDIELPEFASFDLLDSESGIRELRDYYRLFLELAKTHGVGFILESPTWRANPRWGEKLGRDAAALDRINREAIALMEELRAEYADEIGEPIVISGCVGPHDDGYSPTETLGPGEAAQYHSAQVASFAAAGADLITAITMTYAEEAAGIAQAAADAGIPAAISFTVETDGRLPSGQALGEAISQVDTETGSAPAYFMINCAHPTHFEDVLGELGDA